MPLFLVDAFAIGPFTGNPAGVCVLDGPADPAWMQRVSAELNQAATAFVARQEDGSFWLRWFTSTTELNLCGHGSLAAAHIVWERGEPSEDLTFHTPGGRLSARREGERVGLGFPALPPRATDPPEGLDAALDGLTPVWVGRNDLDLFVLAGSEEEVRRLRPRLDPLAALDARGVVVTAPSSDRSFDFVSRYFGPRIGVPEDQATGSAHCGLGPFWAERLHRTELSGRQLSPRGGVTDVRVEGPTRVALVGRAVTVARGQIMSAPESFER